MADPVHHVYLVPGFFGFSNLGDLVYFGHARDFLQEELQRRGVRAQVVPVLAHPTASIRTRAADLLRVVRETAGEGDDPIHLIGHSTGGLDARLLVTPGANLGDGLDPAPYARRVRSVVTVSTPHAGTPLAGSFLSLVGQRLLRVLSLYTLYALRFGRLPLRAVFRLGSIITRADDRLGWKPGLVDQLFSQLLGDFSPERQAALTRFLNEVGNDSSLFQQLTPEGIDLFNAGTPDREGVRYGSVVTQARPPLWRTRVAAGLDPYAQVTHTVYGFLYRRSAQMPEQRLQPLSFEQRMALVRAYGELPGPEANDGIVPTRSQPYGQVLAAVRADHLDTIGHFDDPAHTPAHIDWLISGSGFRRYRFERTWRSVVSFLLGQQEAQAPEPEPRLLGRGRRRPPPGA